MISSSSNILRCRVAGLAVVLALGISLGTPASGRGQTALPSGKVSWGAPCCSITAINLKTGMVTAVDKANQPFRFQIVLSDPSKGRTMPYEPIDGIKLLRSLKVGQKVYANFVTKKVSIDGIEVCCTIVGTTARP